MKDEKTLIVGIVLQLMDMNENEDMAVIYDFSGHLKMFSIFVYRGKSPKKALFEVSFLLKDLTEKKFLEITGLLSAVSDGIWIKDI